MIADFSTFLQKIFFQNIYANYISFYSKLNANKSLQQNYGLKMLGFQDRRTVMTLGKLKFSDVSFSTYSKHPMIMLSEYQLKWFSRSQETLGKYLVHYRPNIFVYCKNAGVCVLFPHILFVISGTKSASFLPIFLCLYSLWIIFLRLNYYLLHIITKVESIYQCMFLQKIIKFFNLKQKQASRGNIMFSVPITWNVTKYFCPIRHSETSATHT